MAKRARPLRHTTFSHFLRGAPLITSMFRAFKNLFFVLLWSGQTVSRLGDSFYTVALAWWVLEKTHSAAAMGLVLVFSSVPMLLLLLVGGLLVDRFSRLHIMVFSDLLRAGIVGAVALLAASGRLEIWHILVMSALFGAVQAFFYPAYTALIPDIVAGPDLTSANSLRNISLQLAGILGPALAGFAVAAGGSWLAFAVDASSFVISACCLLGISRKHLARSLAKEKMGASITSDFVQGLRTVFQSPWLWITITIAGVSNITQMGPFDAVLPLLVAHHFGNSAGIYGGLMAISSLGSLLAALWLGRSKRLRYRGYLAYGAWLLISLVLALMGLLFSLPVMGLAMGIWGAGMTILNLVWANSLQELVLPAYLGRVSSIDALGSYALLPIGYALAGVAADHLGASTVFVLGGIGSACIIVLGLAHPAVRRLD